MKLVYWLVAIIVGLGIVSIGLYVFAKRLQRREPYRSFLRLKTRQKVAFFRLLVRDPRVPWFIKALPFALIAYLVMPFDLIPDFLPVVGYLDDIALVLATVAAVIKFTPRTVVDELIGQACVVANKG